MLNEILLAKFENEVSGKEVTFPAREKKALKRKYEKYFGDGKWRGSIFDLYLQFLEQQEEKGKAVEVPENSFDVYDLAALAYLYKRIKENDPVREASHVVIDEAQDFGMMAYQVLHYCLRDCTYTIMGDTSQNIHFSYGLNDWEELKKLILTGTYDAFGVLRKSYRNTVEIASYAANLIGVTDLELFERHGMPVLERDVTDLEAALREAVDTLFPEEKTYETAAVIVPDEKTAERAYLILREILAEKDFDCEKRLSWLNRDSSSFKKGLTVTTFYLAKGLEFDQVFSIFPKDEKREMMMQAQYIAATRALHELRVYHI